MLEEKIAEDKDNEGKGTRKKLNYVSCKEIKREKEIHNYSQIYIYTEETGQWQMKAMAIWHLKIC